MEISHSLPRFFHHQTLIIVSGDQEARLFLAHQGLIYELEHIHVSNPKYTDREGFFMSCGQGKMFRTGSVYEDKKEYKNKKFLHFMSIELKEVFRKKNITQIYLFAPLHAQAHLHQCIPQVYQKQIKHIFYGNYTKAHPFELLVKIQKQVHKQMQKRELEDISSAAKKLLNGNNKGH